MLKLKDKSMIRGCFPILENLYRKHKDEYLALFFQEKDLDIEGLNLNPLLKTGLIKKVNHGFRANVFVFPLSGKFIVCDFLISLHRVKNGYYLRRRNDVWPIFAYESPYIAKKAIVRKDDSVLDLATGSGVIALLCADKASKVIGVDINPKAINFARFNTVLNNLDDKVKFKLGNLFVSVAKERFDLIIWNGPTIATPDVPSKYPIYCFGGSDGLNFTKKFIEEAPKHLSSGGRMQWLDPSLGSETEPKSLDLIRKCWRNENLNVIYEQRIKPNPIYKLYKTLDRTLLSPSKGFARPLWTEPLVGKEYSDWITLLKENGFSHIHAGMYKIFPGKRFKIIRTRPKKVLFPRMNYLPQDWHFLSLSRIKQLLKICESYGR